ncbi:MAG: hypothetical protein U5Q03_03545 [Bacteroidota bacterium]|nr:hypothetical protein [Bacteroidota bacterium]
MQRKRVVKSIENLTGDILGALKMKYPEGWSNHIIKVKRDNNEFFHAITVDTEDASYLIKVKVKVDTTSDADKFDGKELDDLSDDMDNESKDKSVDLEEDEN